MARRGGSVWVGNGSFRNVKGLENLMKKEAAIPVETTAEIKPALEKGADDLVGAIKAIAPVSELTQDPGELRDSVHREAGDHDLAVKVVEDGKDEKGRPIGKHVEHGHLAADGSHVPGVPHFWPAYRVNRKKIISRVSRATTKGVKKAAALGGSDPT